MSGNYGSRAAARKADPPATVKTTLLSLLGTATTLLLVGLVSGTLISHLIRIVPLLLVLIVAWRWKSAVGAWAAVSLLGIRPESERRCTRAGPIRSP